MPPKGDKVVLRDTGGRAFSVDKEDVDFWVGRGATVEDYQGRKTRAVAAEKREKVKGTAEKIRAAGEGALDMLLPGASGVLSDEAGLRAEVHSGSRAAGSFVGLGLGLLSGSGLATAGKGFAQGTNLSKAIQAGSKYGTGVGGAIIRKGTGIATAGKGGILGSNIAAGAVEGGLFNAAQEVTNLSLTDKPLTGEAISSVILSGAAGALFGAGAGAVGGGIGALAARRQAKQVQKFKGIFDEASDTGKNLRAATDAHLGLADDIASKVRVAGIDSEAAAAINSTRSTLAKSLGTTTPKVDDILKVIDSGDIKKVVSVAKALDDYDQSVLSFVKGQGNPEKYLVSQTGFIDNLKSRVDEMVGKPGVMAKADAPRALMEFAGMEGALALLPEEAVLGDTGSAILQAFLIGNTTIKARGGKGILRQMFEAGAAGQVSGSVLKAARKSRLPMGFAFGAARAGSVAGRKVAAKVLDGDISKIIKTQLTSQGRIGRAVAKGSPYARKVSVPLTAHEALSGVMNDQEKETVKAAKGDARKFLAQMKVLQSLNGDPNKMLKRATDATSGISALNPELGALTRDAMLKKMQFLAEKLPQNPGSMHSITGDRWLPNPQDVAKWTRYAEAVMDPAGIVEKAMANRLTPEAAEVLKRLSPAHFAEMQRRLLEDPKRLENMSYAQRINLGLLFDVPTDPTLTIMPQLQEHFRVLDEQAAAAVQAGPTPEAPSTGLNEPTNAQKLENR